MLEVLISTRLDTAVAVSREFRERIAEEYPQAFTEERFGRLFQELLFPQWRDDVTGDPVLDRKRLAMLEGREAALAGNRYNGLAFLTAFSEELDLPLEMEEADWLQGRARTVRAVLPVRLEMALIIELLMFPTDGMVDFVSGRRVSPSRRERMRAQRRRARREFTPKEGVNAHWVKFLNATPPNVFKQAEKYFDQALAVAETLYPPSRVLANLKAIQTLRDAGLDPAYKEVERTTRIYTWGPSTAQLSSRVRAVLFAGSLHFDLAAAQLAIISKLWQLPRIAETLNVGVPVGGSIWTPLLALAGIVPERKEDFKELVYAAAYGMGMSRLQRKAAEWLQKDEVEALFQSVLMTELLQGRQERLTRIRAEGGIRDAFGQRITLDDRKRRGHTTPHNSLLAHEAQAYEFLLMRPALEFAERNEEFRMLLWLHDGMYVHVTQPERAEDYSQRVTLAVDEQAKRLGFSTRLVLERLL